MRDGLLLLAAPSRESRDKAEAFAAAARKLSLEPRIVVADSGEKVSDPGMALRFALPCSDALAPAAARLNAVHGTGGFAPELVALLGDKAAGIPFLSRLLGLSVLPQLVPRCPDDVRAWRYRGPVIVKPTSSAGGWSPRPWGYRCFASPLALLDWLDREARAIDFFSEQRQAGPLGPALLQAAVDGSCIETVSLLLTPEHATVYCRGYAQFEPDTAAGSGRRWWRAVYHPQGAPALARRLPRLKRQRWGRGLLHVQALRGPAGRLYLTDINLRPATAWSWLASAAMPLAHYRLLAALLFDMPLELEPPAKAMAIDLVHDAARPASAPILHAPPGDFILPYRMTPPAGTSSGHGFDKAAAALSFVTLAGTAAECAARADAFRAGIHPGGPT